MYTSGGTRDRVRGFFSSNKLNRFLVLNILLFSDLFRLLARGRNQKRNFKKGPIVAAAALGGERVSTAFALVSGLKTGNWVDSLRVLSWVFGGWFLRRDRFLRRA